MSVQETSVSFFDSLENYLEPEFKTVSLYLGGASTDNPHLFTAEAEVLASRRREALGLIVLARQAVEFASACMDIPGLLRRYPSSTGTMSYDELIGALVSCWYASRPDLALQILEYLEENGYTMNPEHPGERTPQSFLVRDAQVLPLARRVARKPADRWDATAWSAGLLLSIFSFPSWDQPWAGWWAELKLRGKKGFIDRTDTSGKILCDVQLEIMRESSALARGSILIWLWAMGLIYRGGRRQLYGIYMPPGHPLAGYQASDWRTS